MSIIDGLKWRVKPQWPFLIGLTQHRGAQTGRTGNCIWGSRACIDIVQGLKMAGFQISITDARGQHHWSELTVRNLTPRGLNRLSSLTSGMMPSYISCRDSWSEMDNPRAIVFCGTIDHAVTMRDRINALGFTRADALTQRELGPSISPSTGAGYL